MIYKINKTNPYINNRNRSFIMIKLTGSILNALWMSAILLCTVSVHAMEQGYKQLALGKESILQGDTLLLKKLFENGIDPNQKTDLLDYPIFFFSPTISIAQICIDNGADVHMLNHHDSNVLWHAIHHNFSEELVDFYLTDCAVNPRIITPWDGDNILHRLARLASYATPVSNVNNYVKKVALLIDTIPDMVNKPNKKGKTSVDIAQKNLDLLKLVQENYAQLSSKIPIHRPEHYNNTRKALKSFIFLCNKKEERQKNLLIHFATVAVNKGMSLQESIAFFLKLKITCKRFDELLTLETIGEFYKKSNSLQKDMLFDDIMGDFLFLTDVVKNRYVSERVPLAILVYAGGKQEGFGLSLLLDKAVCFGDSEMVKILFEHGEDPTKQTSLELDRFLPTLRPLFFNAGTKEVAQVFLDYGVDLHATDAYGHNVLSYIYRTPSLPVEVLAFYLHHPSLVKQSLCGNTDILHNLGSSVRKYVELNNNSLLEKAKTLLNATSAMNMINALNKKGHTPLDELQLELKYVHNCFKRGLHLSLGLHHSKVSKQRIPIIEELIALLKEHGGKTSQELQKETMVLLLHNDYYVGNFSMLPYDIRKYIVPYMMHHLNSSLNN